MLATLSVLISFGSSDASRARKRLPGKDYSLLMLNQFTASLTENVVRLRAGPSDQLTPMEKLLPSVKLATSAETMAQSIVTNKYAGVTSWVEAIYIRNLAEKYISREKIPKKCYIGKKFFLQQNPFCILTPPNVKQLTARTRSMIEAGLYELWQQEFIGLATSPRVQGPDPRSSWRIRHLRRR